MSDGVPTDEQLIELDDTAAEPDSNYLAEPEVDDDEPDPPVFTGMCVGGPYNDRTITSRFPGGFVLVDRVRNRAWVYVAGKSPDGVAVFVCRDPAGAVLDEAGRWRAAESADYDVIVYDPEVWTP
jgi:hypothetical protein